MTAPVERDVALRATVGAVLLGVDAVAAGGSSAEFESALLLGLDARLDYYSALLGDPTRVGAAVAFDALMALGASLKFGAEAAGVPVGEFAGRMLDVLTGEA
jgi:hypothetical protein